MDKNLPQCLHLRSRLQSGPSHTTAYQPLFHCPDCAQILPAWALQEGIMDALHRAQDRCEALEARTQQLLALADALAARLDALEAKQWTASEVLQANQDHG